MKLRRAVLELRAARVFTVVAGRRRRKQRTDLLGRLDCQTASRVRLPSPGWSPSHRHRTSRGPSAHPPRARCAAGWPTRPRYSTDSVDWIAFYAPLIDPALHPVTRPLFTRPPSLCRPAQRRIWVCSACSAEQGPPQKGGPQIRFNDLTRYCGTGWWRGTVVERRSLTGELALSCA